VSPLQPIIISSLSLFSILFLSTSQSTISLRLLPPYAPRNESSFFVASYGRSSAISWSGIFATPCTMRKHMADRRIWLESSHAISRHSWLSGGRNWTTCYHWLSSPKTRHTICHSRLPHFGPRWDSWWWCGLFCWYQSRVPTVCWKSSRKQMSLLNRCSQLSACWERGWRTCKHRWFGNLISLAASTISRWEILLFSKPGSSQPAMQIVPNRTW